jgi:hypothetical protein
MDRRSRIKTNDECGVMKDMLAFIHAAAFALPHLFILLILTISV